MGFWKRLVRVVKANLGSLLSKAEEPEKMLEQLVEEMREQLQEAKRQVALAIGDEKRLHKQWMEEDKQAETRESQAMRALQVGDEELAKAALLRKKQHEELAREYQKQWEIQKEAVEKLKTALHALNQKIEEAARKKTLLLARKQRAEAQQTVQQTVTGLSDQSAFETFDRMAEKIDVLEAQVEANHELSMEIQSQDLDARFRKLESQHPDVDDALAALKAKMAASPKAAAKEPVQETAKEAVKEKERVMRDEERW
ncbi:PspA/IM30 family protein [Myxococcota bacterium]|nr:PspA/IM30 family protein [Myxococcota bacterium]